MDFDLGLDILNNLANNRLAPVPEEQTEDLFRAIEFPMICKSSNLLKFIEVIITTIYSFDRFVNDAGYDEPCTTRCHSQQ